jgi:hypothetical protein
MASLRYAPYCQLSQKISYKAVSSRDYIGGWQLSQTSEFKADLGEARVSVGSIAAIQASLP